MEPTNDATRASAEALPDTQSENRDIGDVIDILGRALSLSELLYLAADSLWHGHHQKEGDAIMVGADVLRDILKDAKGILDELSEGGPA